MKKPYSDDELPYLARSSTFRTIIWGTILTMVSSIGYIFKNENYFYSYPLPEVVQEFKTEFETFKENLEGKTLPTNADTENIIDLTVYVDADFKRNYDHWLSPFDNESWMPNLEKGLETATQRIYNQFNIAYKIKEIKPYENPDHLMLIYTQMYKLQDEENKTIGSILFSGKYPNLFAAGVASSTFFPEQEPSFKVQAIIKSHTSIPLENLIQHELSHWLGAKDYDETVKNPPDSIMNYYTVTDTITWDDENIKAMDITTSWLLEYIELQKNLKTEQD